MVGSPPMVFYITICCIAFIASKIVVSLLCYKRWVRKRRLIEDSLSGGGKMVMFPSPATQALSAKAFVKNTMKLTNKDILGSGGYGTVYRFVVDESTTFAVKKLNRGNENRDMGFERELNSMADIKHRNIVTLHGYYVAPQFNLLIYELMPNGSLDALLQKNLDTSIEEEPLPSPEYGKEEPLEEHDKPDHEGYEPPSTLKFTKDHPKELVIRATSKGLRTRASL